MGNAVILEVGIAVTARGYFGKIRSIEVLRQLFAEIADALGVAVAVILAPCAVDLVDAPCGAIRLYFAALPRNHTLVKEADYRAVLTAICGSCLGNRLRFCEAVAIAHDPLQSFDGLIEYAVTLGIHFVE